MKKVRATYLFLVGWFLEDRRLRVFGFRLLFHVDDIIFVLLVRDIKVFKSASIAGLSVDDRVFRQIDTTFGQHFSLIIVKSFSVRELGLDGGE